MPSNIYAFLAQTGLSLVLGLVVGMAQAEKADRDKPFNIEADSLRHEELKQISVFSGKVVATKGSIVLRGSRLEVRQDPAGFQHAQLNADGSARAFFRQKREGLNEFMEGEAQTIQYDGRLDQVTLSGQAQLRRLRGTQLADEIVGQVITYNNLTEVFSVDGKAPAAATGTPGAAAPSARVRAVLTPLPPAAGDKR